MKDEDKLLQIQIPTIQVSNKQAYLFICAFFGYPVYFGLPNGQEVSGHDAGYVLTTTEWRVVKDDIADIKLELLELRPITAMMAENNLKLIETHVKQADRTLDTH